MDDNENHFQFNKFVCTNLFVPGTKIVFEYLVQKELGGEKYVFNDSWSR